MKIKLISPRMTLRPMDSDFKRLLSPSISLLVVAALTPKNHDVYLEDENIQEINTDDDPDLVGINVNVDTSQRAYRLAAAYRRRNIPVVLGGIHASSNPTEALQHADTVCIGQAEHLWPQIVYDADQGKLQRIYQYNDEPNLALTPIPRWDLLDTSNYLYTSIVCASRGCPFKCEFCYNSCEYMRGGHLNRPIENVIEEINRLDTRQVMFIDDNFIGNIAWTRELIRHMKPMHLRWHAAVSTNIGYQLKLLDEMRNSGCESLFIGFESINHQSIKSAAKMQNHVEHYERIISQLHSRGIMVNASMVFGFDHDAPDVFADTLEWLVHNKIETVTAHILTPYPGTRLYQRLRQDGRIIDFEPTHYNTSHVVFQPKQMTAEQLFNGYLWVYKEFYTMKNIYRRIPRDYHQWTPYLLFNLIYRKYGKFTSRIARNGLMNSLGKLARRLSYGIE